MTADELVRQCIRNETSWYTESTVYLYSMQEFEKAWDGHIIMYPAKRNPYVPYVKGSFKKFRFCNVEGHLRSSRFWTVHVPIIQDSHFHAHRIASRMCKNKVEQFGFNTSYFVKRAVLEIIKQRYPQATLVDMPAKISYGSP